MMNCPLCLEKNITDYHRDKNREYWQCQNCLLVFVDRKYLLNEEMEKATYDLHENNPNDLGYRTFLNKLLEPMSKKLNPNSVGLDFGSGPGPTIKIMMEELGHKMNNYDIFYATDASVLYRDYDFITCTEVIEHLSNPHLELTRLTSMLNKNGLLGIMTKRVVSHEKFKTWHYKNDLTHVCFYSDATFEYIAAKWNYKLEVVNSDTVILQCQ